MATDIGHLHHVGHVVRDMRAALALYRRLGFTLPPPAYPAMPPREDAEPEPFGAANTHADFPHSFVELATYVPAGDAGTVPDDATVVPLQGPPDALPRLVESIAATSGSLATFLDRFEGLHILLFSSSDVDATAARLSASGVEHSGVRTVQRPAKARNGETGLEALRFLEIDAREGRLGAAADLDPDFQGARQLDHANGATDLVEAVLCVADAGLQLVREQYEGYLGRPARAAGPALAFDLDGATVTVVPHSALATLLPGERSPTLPALVAYTVSVADLDVTRKLLQDNGFPLKLTAGGDLFVPADAALGTAVVFRGQR